MSEESEGARRDLRSRTLAVFSWPDFGSTGNISVRLPDGGWLMTPTNASLGRLDPANFRNSTARSLRFGGKPTKEAFLHFCMYRNARKRARSCICIRPIGRRQPACGRRPPRRAAAAHRLFCDAGRPLALAPYFPPGDETLAKAVRALQASITLCFSPTTAPSSPARRWRTPNMRPRNSKRRPSFPDAARRADTPADAGRSERPARAI